MTKYDDMKVVDEHELELNGRRYVMCLDLVDDNGAWFVSVTGKHSQYVCFEKLAKAQSLAIADFLFGRNSYTMTLEFGGFEVKIKAKAWYHDDYNEDDTHSLLNLISLAFSEAAEHNEIICQNDLGRKQASREIYQALKAAGAYNNL